MCEDLRKKHEEEQKVIEQQLDEKSGYAFYEHSLQLDQDRRKSEVDREIARLKAETTLTTDEEIKLRTYAPPAPDFDVIPEQQAKEMGFFKGKTPRKQIKNYKQRRAEWENSHDGVEYRKVKDQIQNRIAIRKDEEQKVAEAVGKDEKPLYQEIKADPTSMTKALKRMSIEDNFGIEKGISENEVRHSIFGYGDVGMARDALTAYMNGGYDVMNDYMRTGRTHKGSTFSHRSKDELADTLHSMLSTRKINRDMVVRRGVSKFSTLSFMMDGGKSKDLSGPELAKLLQDKMADGNVILTDKGFVSTSVREQSGFGAGTYQKGTNLGKGKEAIYTEPGIEFIILVKKGTRAMDICGAGVMGQADNEDELLIDAGTKFRVVKAYFNEDADKKKDEEIPDEEKICMGHKCSWKIYLETIPDSENGELN